MIQELSLIKEQLFDAPVEVKQAFNDVVRYFSGLYPGYGKDGKGGPGKGKLYPPKEDFDYIVIGISESRYSKTPKVISHKVNGNIGSESNAVKDTEYEYRDQKLSKIKVFKIDKNNENKIRQEIDKYKEVLKNHIAGTPYGHHTI